MPLANIFVRSPLVSSSAQVVIRRKPRGQRETTMDALLERILIKLKIKPHTSHQPLHLFYKLVATNDPGIFVLVDDPDDIDAGDHFILLRKNVAIIPPD
jgi:hypothetical protein